MEFCRILTITSQGELRVVMSCKLCYLTFCVVLYVSNIYLPVESVKPRSRRAADGTSRVFVVRRSASGELFTVGSVPPSATSRFQFVGTAPAGLILDGSTGMISRNQSAVWDAPTSINFRVTHRTAAAPG